jgi:hypothetical protein
MQIYQLGTKLAISKNIGIIVDTDPVAAAVILAIDLPGLAILELTLTAGW